LICYITNAQYIAISYHKPDNAQLFRHLIYSCSPVIWCRVIDCAILVSELLANVCFSKPPRLTEVPHQNTPRTKTREFTPKCDGHTWWSASKARTGSERGPKGVRNGVRTDIRCYGSSFLIGTSASIPSGTLGNIYGSIWSFGKGYRLVYYWNYFWKTSYTCKHHSAVHLPWLLVHHPAITCLTPGLTRTTLHIQCVKKKSRLINYN